MSLLLRNRNEMLPGHFRQVFSRCFASAIMLLGMIGKCFVRALRFIAPMPRTGEGPCQSIGLRAVTIHAAPSMITDRSPARPSKAARTAIEAWFRISSG